MNNARKLADFTSEELTYAIVIATRNRVDALRISLPLMLEQSRRPKQIVIVDSSDDPTQVGTLVNGIQSDVPIHLLRSEAGTSLQRNLGVGLVSESVTFFWTTTLYYSKTPPSISCEFTSKTSNNVLAEYALRRRCIHPSI